MVDGVVASFALTLVLVMGYSFLEVAGFPPLNSAYIGTFMALVLVVGKLWAMWRLR